MTQPPSLAEIRERLASYTPKIRKPGSRFPASVALILRFQQGVPEILLIERAEHEDDPWSGHLGFPGGRLEHHDAGPRQAAERETMEEVGLDLVEAEYLGQLDDLEGAHLPVLVSCFVYHLRHLPDLRLSREVATAFWTPLAILLDPRRYHQISFTVRDREIQYPAVRLLEDGRPFLWGITYRLIGQFLEVLGRPMTDRKGSTRPA